MKNLKAVSVDHLSGPIGVMGLDVGNGHLLLKMEQLIRFIALFHTI